MENSFPKKMIQTLILFSLLNSVWILVFKLIGPLVRKMIHKEAVEEQSSTMKILIDVIFFSFAANGFYFFFFKIIPLDIVMDNIMPGFWVLTIWFGGLSFIGYLNLQRYIRWWAIAITVYFVVILAIMQFEVGKNTANVLDQFFNVFTAFMTVLFPAELGNLFRKIN